MKSALALLSLLPAVCAAQSLYRCGNTYSQTPCAAAASAVRLSPGAAPETPAATQPRELCGAATVGVMQLPDANMARVESVVKGNSEAIEYAGKPMVARTYLVTVNVANAYGMYTGPKVHACYLSEDEQRVLKVVLKR
jgi:hypothetical protein